MGVGECTKLLKLLCERITPGAEGPGVRKRLELELGLGLRICVLVHAPAGPSLAWEISSLWNLKLLGKTPGSLLLLFNLLIF